MTVTDLNAVQNQVQEFWAPLFTKELRETMLLGGLVNKDYEGQIRQPGDTVYVSQINAPSGENRTVGTDADSFATEQLSTSRISVQANKRAVAAFEFEDLVQLQSQLGQQDSEIRQSLLYAVNKQINNYLYTQVSPSTSAPDHVVDSVTDFNAAQLSSTRKLAAKAKWMRDRGWWLLADPSYYGDILDDTTLSSADYGASDAPMIGGQLALPRMGFNILEDNTEGLVDNLGTSGEDCALAFHPDFLHMVMQQEARFKVSDLHSNKKFGFVISVDVVYGAALGIDGDNKHIRIYNS